MDDVIDGPSRERDLRDQDVTSTGQTGSTSRLIFGEFGAPGVAGGQEVRITRKGDQGVVAYGPYEMRGPGDYEVALTVGVAGARVALGDPVCVVLDVVTGDGRVRLAERRLLLSDLSPGLAEFAISFTLHETRVVEYRVHSSGQVGLQVAGSARITRVGDLSAVPPIKTGRERAWLNEREFLDGYLRNISGVIHVGANVGQERRYYWLLGVDVIWVEPIRELYERLVDNISIYDRQRAISALLADEDGKTFELGIANNGGASSSVLPLEDHGRLWPDIAYMEKRELVSETLDTLIRRECIPLSAYPALTLDVEGAELLVLKGATQALKSFTYVKCEVADFPARTGTPTAADLDDLLVKAGFTQLIRRAFAMGPEGEGSYWDIVWKRVPSDGPVQEPGVKLPIVAHPQDVEGLEKCE